MAEVTLHRFREWPAGMIGPAEILWRPQETPSTGDRKGKRKQVGDPSARQGKDARQIWIRLHPSIFDETYTTFVKAITSFYQRDNAHPSEGSGVELRDLRGSINCFELTGPRALQILESVLDVCRNETAPKKAVSMASYGRFFS
jgi:ribonuclease P/MRP protein subunit POP1